MLEQGLATFLANIQVGELLDTTTKTMAWEAKLPILFAVTGNSGFTCCSSRITCVALPSGAMRGPDDIGWQTRSGQEILGCWPSARGSSLLGGVYCLKKIIVNAANFSNEN